MAFCGTLLLVIIFMPIPLWVSFFYNVNLYYNFVQEKFQDSLQSEYDFIIVGAGSAGGPIVNRLSKHHKVLLIEAGGDPLWIQKVPMLAPNLLFFNETSWNYKTVPQEFSSFSQKNKQSLWPRGKSLGGSSNLNYMLYVRSSYRDYDNWADLTDDASWRYENLLPYFKKSVIYEGYNRENYTNYGNSPYATMYVTPSGRRHMDIEFEEAYKELGFETVDTNSYQKTGFDSTNVFVKDGVRWDTFTGFIKPILSRKNLHVTRYSHAYKVQLDKSKRATGVWYLKNGRRIFAKARKEVILSAGTVDSPKILILSGIGPREDLLRLKIKPLVDLPVGQNLEDHLNVYISNIGMNESISYDFEKEFGVQDVTDYLLRSRGIFSQAVPVNKMGFYSTKRCREADGDWPDLQIYLSYGSQYSRQAEDLEAIYGMNATHTRSLFADISGQEPTFSVGIALVRPKSVGKITLRDKNPLSDPIIDPRYLEHPDDIRALTEGYELVLQLVENTTTFRKLGAYVPNTPLLPCAHFEFRSALYWECYSRHLGVTVYHPTGTCKMGKEGDPLAVVDSKLRVIGTSGLRVADASIMPKIVNGNTHAPTIMIGEKAADMIREYWSSQYLVCLKPSNYYESRNSRSCHYSQIV